MKRSAKTLDFVIPVSSAFSKIFHTRPKDLIDNFSTIFNCQPVTDRLITVREVADHAHRAAISEVSFSQGSVSTLLRRGEHVFLCMCKNLLPAYSSANIIILECGPMSNVMAALPNIDSALCSTPQSLADAQYWSAVQ